MLMLAAYSVLMRSLAGVSDMVIGVATTGRPEARFDTTIGMFVNTLPLRLAPEGELSFSGFLDRVREICADAYQHQDIPFELITENTGVSIGTMFTYEVADERRFNLAGLEIEEIDAPIPGSMFDFSLDAIEKNNAIHLDFEFDRELLNGDYVRFWAECFTSLIERICENPDALIGSIKLIPDRLEDELLFRWNDTRYDHKESQTIIKLFETIVSTSPHDIAVIAPDGEMTYAALDSLSNQVSEVLQSEYGIGSESNL